MSDTLYRDYILSLNPWTYLREDDAAGSSTLADVSPNGRNATFTTGSAQPDTGALETDDTEGQLGDGSREARFTDNAWLDSILLGSYSEIVWFKTTDSSQVRRLAGRNKPQGSSAGGLSQGLILTGPAAQGVGVYFYTGSNRDVNAVFTPENEYDYSDGEWHMVVGSREVSGGTVWQRLHLNGELRAERQEVVAPVATTHPFGVMSDGGQYPDEKWLGSHDEFALVPLMTDAEISLAFCLGRPSRCGGLYVGCIGMAGGLA